MFQNGILFYFSSDNTKDYDPFELSILKLQNPCYYKDLVCREVCLNGKNLDSPQKRLGRIHHLWENVKA